MFEMTLPDPGEGLLEAEITQWLVSVGDEVKVNDVVVEIETAKSLVELPAPAAGVVAALHVEVGSIVAVGGSLMSIRESRDVASEDAETQQVPAASGDLQESAATEKSGSVLVGYGTSASGAKRRSRKVLPAKPSPGTDQVQERDLADAPVQQVDPVGRPLAKPAVRRLARDLGINLKSIAGTGPNGTITPNDVAQAAALEASGRRVDTRIPLRGIRRQMLQAMQASLQVPQASVWMDVDVTETVALIEQLKQRREFSGLRISPIIVLAKAVCLAMVKHPEVNASLDLDRQEIVVHPDVNLGIAAATQRGLVVPNIKAANELNILQLAQALNELVDKVREGRVTLADAADGTFTITNVGVFGVEGGTPILNPNESAILLLGTFNRRPWAVGSGEDERMEIRSVAKLTLTIDHRVLDGEQASRFLADVATILTNPGLSLLF